MTNTEGQVGEVEILCYLSRNMTSSNERTTHGDIIIVAGAAWLRLGRTRPDHVQVVALAEQAMFAAVAELTLVAAVAELTLVAAVAELALVVAVAELALVAAVADMALVTAVAELALVAAVADLALVTAVAELALVAAVADMALVAAVADIALVAAVDEVALVVAVAEMALIRNSIPYTINNLPKQVASKIRTHSQTGFKTYAKHFFIESYQETCTRLNCCVCSV